MIGTHLKMAWRNLRKRPAFSLIKLTGLCAGVAACLLIGLYLQHETSYDGFHANAERIVRATMAFQFSGEPETTQYTGNKLANVLRREFPEVATAARVIKYGQVVKAGEQPFDEPNFYYADSTFFQVFTFPLLAGDPLLALSQPKQVVISESMARKYFQVPETAYGSLLGKTLKINDATDYTISAVMADPPANSQMKPEFIGSFLSLRDAEPARETYWNANYATYALLHQADQMPALQSKLDTYMQNQWEGMGLTGGDYLKYHLEKLRDVHLRSEVPGNFEPNGDIRYVYLLSIVALLILLIAASTYINLTTAAATERAREVGVQKVIGAGQQRLFWQHITESVLLSLLAVLSGLALTYALLPVFNRLFERQLEFHTLFSPIALCLMTGFGLLLGLLSGLYPAIVITRMRPIAVLRGAFKFSASGIWLRQSLVVLQFGIAIFLVICTGVLQQQMQFIRDKNLGYDRDHVLVLPTDGKINQKVSSFKSEFLQDSRVKAVSLSYETPVFIQGGYSVSTVSAEDNGVPVTALPADEDFINAMNIQLLAGRGITAADVEAEKRLDQGDSTVVRSIVINASQSRDFGWTPEEAIGKKVYFNGGPATIEGVTADFHFASLHEPITNLIIFPTSWGQHLLVKLSGKDIPGTLASIEQKWQSLAPHRPFSYHFMDEEFDDLYQDERRSSAVISVFSFVAILLACLGLFGLASFVIAQRTKEIGVRRVLGASTAAVIGLLSRQFLILVVIALILAAPLAAWLMHEWLGRFTYNGGMPWLIFPVAAVVVLSVAFLSVGIQSIRAALVNPVKSLRSE